MAVCTLGMCHSPFAHLEGPYQDTVKSDTVQIYVLNPVRVKALIATCRSQNKH